MQTTNLGKVAIKNDGVSRSKEPLNRNIYGSCGFGEVSVHQLLQLEPDDKTMINNETLLYLASIISPTYGHVNLKFWNYFVQMTDLTKNYKEFLAQTNVRRSGGLFVPTQLPHAPRNLVALMFLYGAHMTAYEVSVDPSGTRTYTTPSGTYGNPSEMAKLATFYGNLVARSGGLFSSGTQNSFLGYYSLHVDARALVDFSFEDSSWNNYVTDMWIPLSNPSEFTVGEIIGNGGSPLLGADGVDIEPVTIDGADFLIERDFVYNGTTYHYAFAFRMHAFGSRIYKLLKGAESQEDWTSNKPMSLMPLFATFKAYFDCFGLLLYTNYENTACAELMNLYDEYNVSDFAFGFVTGTTVSVPDELDRLYVGFQAFIKEFGSLWVTSSQDWESAHTKTIGVSPKVDVGNPGFAASFPSTPNTNLVTNAPVGSAHVSIPDENTDVTGLGVTQQAFINNVFHGQLDSELLKKLYLITNRNTIAGKRVEELLRANGFGKWMEHQKPRFISYEEIPVDFSKVLAQADTLQSNGKDGALLGDRGGYAQGYKYGKKMFYHNDETGFLVVLMAVVPDAGLTQVQNVAFDCIKRHDFFIPAFDGMGQEMSKIKQIVGALPVSVGNRQNVTEQSFGFIPRESKFKVHHNILNGNFARRSRRDYYLTYCMDKFINIGDVISTSDENTTVNGDKVRQIKAFESFAPSALPLAGLAWRYPTRYPWLGLFTRIFANLGDSVARWRNMFSSTSGFKKYEFVNNEDDGFFYMSTIRGCRMTHKLPITDSFETREDGNSGSIDTNIAKA